MKKEVNRENETRSKEPDGEIRRKRNIVSQKQTKITSKKD